MRSDSRLIVLNAPPSVRRSLAGRWAGQVVPLDGEWDASALSDLALSAHDVVLYWAARGSHQPWPAVTAIHAHHPRVPVLASVPGDDPATIAALLAAGVHEFLRGPADLPHAVAVARARAGQPVDAARQPSLFPNQIDWIYVVGIAEDGTMRFETVNPPLHPADEFLRPDFAGRTPEDCLPPAGAALMRAHLEQVLADGQPMQFDEEHPVGGRTRSFQTVLTPVRNKWGRIHRIAGLSRDTTALREAQAALRASEERLAHALEGTQQGLWDWDLVQGVVYRSPRWFEMLGLWPGDVDDSLDAGLARIHKDDLPAVRQAIRLHLDGHSPRFQAEYRIQTGAGDWLWLFDAGKVVGWTSDGKAARIAGLCTDITERRRAEESLRALVGGVVHEMRNPAFGISVNLDALEATFGDDGRFTPFVAALRESCSRIQSLMNDLRDYGEPRTLRAEPCQVWRLLDDALQSCGSLMRERGVEVAIDFDDPALVLPLHSLRMHQVFRNLLENAFYHAPAGSTVNVISRTARRREQEWWTFAVEDRGTGFDHEALARAFEPFFTRRKGGTGLGLSIVRRVVEEHGGTVDATNRPGGGAAVVVRIPLARHKAPAAAGHAHV